jgi:hypothetical protein
MSFSRVGPPGGWSVGAVFTSAEANALDVDHANALDKTAAGDTLLGPVTVTTGTIILAGTPTLTCTVNGALQSPHVGGIQATVAGGIEATVAGGIQSTVAGGIQGGVVAGIQSGVAGGIQLSGGANDWETFSATRSRSVVQPMLVFQYTTGWGSGGSAGVLSALSGPATTQVIAIPIWPHNGATIASITMFLGVVNHTAVPAVLPSMAVKRNTIVNNGTYNPVDLSTTANQAFPTPASGAAWTDSNAQQSWTYTANQNNVVDRTQYNYWIQLTDENGSNSVAGNQYWGFIINYTGIADMRFQ